MVPFDSQIMPYDLDDLLNRFSISLRNHSRRVAVCSAIIAEYAGAFICESDIPSGTSLPEIAHLGGTCHDIGKLMFPAIRSKDNDYLTHPSIGADLLERYLVDLFGNEPSAQMVLDIVRCHHEQTDGGGFPEGRKSKDVPFVAGICSVANRLDHNMYKENALIDIDARIFEMLSLQSGRHYCEYVWFCVERAWPRLMERYAEWTGFANRNEY